MILHTRLWCICKFGVTIVNMSQLAGSKAVERTITNVTIGDWTDIWLCQRLRWCCERLLRLLVRGMSFATRYRCEISRRLDKRFSEVSTALETTQYRNTLNVGKQGVQLRNKWQHDYKMIYSTSFCLNFVVPFPTLHSTTERNQKTSSLNFLRRKFGQWPFSTTGVSYGDSNLVTSWTAW